MSTMIGLIKYPLIAGVASVATARARDLSLWEIALAFPLGVAVYLVTEWTPLPPVSNEDGAS